VNVPLDKCPKAEYEPDRPMQRMETDKYVCSCAFNCYKKSAESKNLLDLD